MFAYGNMIRYDPKLMDLTSNFFVLCTTTTISVIMSAFSSMYKYESLFI